MLFRRVAPVILGRKPFTITWRPAGCISYRVPRGFHTPCMWFIRKREFRCTRWRVPPAGAYDAPSDEPWIVALRSCYRASAGVLVRSAFSEVERHQILDVAIWWAQR